MAQLVLPARRLHRFLMYVSKTRAGNMGERMTAIVAEGDRKTSVPLSLTMNTSRCQCTPNLDWRPSGRLPEQALGFRVQRYGFTNWHQLFTERQLTALTTFSDLVPGDVHEDRLHGMEQVDEYARLCLLLIYLVSMLESYQTQLF